MKNKIMGTWRRQARRLARRLFAALPTALRFGLYRRAMDFAPAQGGTLELKIAHTQAELEQCFALLHDAYVASGFMRPHPSGLRVTPYHALPTTTTLCAKVGEQVVGTLSIVREGVFGFPMQTAFDISSVRAKEGRIAEISALAVHPRYRKTGGSVLFPLMKFMYEYCTKYFDTRHLLIAVNPGHIEMYESLLFFQRLTAQTVDHYDFANGAPAVGATLDLQEAPAIFERAYGHKPGRRNLHRYFCHTTLSAIQFPPRPWHLSNDPVLTPALMDHFFNQRTQGFDGLEERKRRLLHSLYPGAAWAAVLPHLPAPATDNGVTALRAHPRFSLKCPASMNASGLPSRLLATIVEISRTGFMARLLRPLQVGMRCEVLAELGEGVRAQVQAHVVREVDGSSGQFYGFQVDRSDEAWQRCVAWLEGADTRPASAAPGPDALAPSATRPAEALLPA